jgi:aspartate kinase
MRSVALLTLHLEELGVRVVGLNIHEMGLHLNEVGKARPIIEVVSHQIKRALEGHSVVVVPGFFGTKEGGIIASLGRGGSDLSAVLLADEFDAGRCELIQDVEGYFTDDPDSNPGANYLPWISYETAEEMAERGCELVQRVALEAARQRGLQIVVRKLDGAVPGTVVSSPAD